MRRLEIAALLCVVFLLMPACKSNKLEQDGAKTGVEKLVTIDANCRTDEPPGGVHISRGASDHVRWTAPAGYKFRVTFKDETPCHRSASAGAAAVARYTVEGGQKTNQCFPLKDTPTDTSYYQIENLSSGNPVVCADPAVIVDN